jgi:predicted Fe-S protein YdhL (DUF1289 family)
MKAHLSHLILLTLLACSLHMRAADALPAPDLPPIPPSPIEEFRSWLKMSEDERAKVLATYPAAKQEVLKRKLQAYASMPTDERDARLHALELRWYLEPLIIKPATERGAFLQIIPERLHREILARLKHWDGLSEGLRSEILADQKKREMATGYFVHSGRALRPPTPVVMPPHPRDYEADLRRWETADAAARERMTAHLATFFQLSPEEQRKHLAGLPQGEHEEMQNTLAAFARLSPEVRRACVASFQKFATMDPKERASFLRNAARWQKLTPQERQAWRELVSKIPPMPPMPVVEPPLPSANSNATPRKFASTNRGPTPFN